MKTRRNFLLLPLLSLMGLTALAQDNNFANPSQKAAQVQPTIMVIPFTKENENIRTIMESDVNKRIAITKVKEGFDKRGVNTIDFLAKLKQGQTDKAFEMDNQTSIKQQIIELSGADIYVETEVNLQNSSSGNSVTVILTGYDAFSGQSLANKVGTSPKFYTSDFSKLTEKAVESCIEDFLNTMNAKFSDIVENGRTLSLNVTFAQNSKYTMDTEVGSGKELLSDALEEWLSKNSHKKYFHIQGVTATKLMADDVRVPLKDAAGNNFRPSRFAADLRKYLKSLGIESSRDIQGTKLFVTIN